MVTSTPSQHSVALLGLAESDPVPCPLPSVPHLCPRDSPQPLPAPEEEEALTTEDFELLDFRGAGAAKCRDGVGSRDMPRAPDASPPPPLGPTPLPQYSQTRRIRPWQSHKPGGTSCRHSRASWLRMSLLAPFPALLGRSNMWEAGYQMEPVHPPPACLPACLPSAVPGLGQYLGFVLSL